MFKLQDCWSLTSSWVTFATVTFISVNHCSFIIPGTMHLGEDDFAKTQRQGRTLPSKLIALAQGMESEAFRLEL